MRAFLYIIIVESLLQLQQEKLFGIEIFNSLLDDSHDIVFSPLCLQTSFSLIYPGSQGINQRQFQTILGFSPIKTPEEVFHSFTDYDKRVMESIPGEPHFYLATRLFTTPTLSLLPKFVELLQNDIQKIAFDSKSGEALNAWVSDETEDVINDFEATLDSHEDFVIASALGIKASWALPFPLKNTHKNTFYTTPGRKVVQDNVRFMQQTADFLYYENERFQMVTLPYHNSQKIELLIYLPRIDNFKFTEAMIRHGIEGRQSQSVKVTIPKFKIETTLDDKLKDVLISAGLTQAFQGEGFHGITSEAKALSGVIQRNAFSMGESGTFGSKPSVTTPKPLNNNWFQDRYPRDYETFTADHPFTFLIWDNSEGHILYIGRLATFGKRLRIPPTTHFKHRTPFVWSSFFEKWSFASIVIFGLTLFGAFYSFCWLCFRPTLKRPEVRPLLPMT